MSLKMLNDENFSKKKTFLKNLFLNNLKIYEINRLKLVN